MECAATRGARLSSSLSGPVRRYWQAARCGNDSVIFPHRAPPFSCFGPKRDRGREAAPTPAVSACGVTGPGAIGPSDSCAGALFLTGHPYSSQSGCCALTFVVRSRAFVTMTIPGGLSRLN